MYTWPAFLPAGQCEQQRATAASQAAAPCISSPSYDVGGVAMARMGQGDFVAGRRRVMNENACELLTTLPHDKQKPISSGRHTQYK